MTDVDVADLVDEDGAVDLRSFNDGGRSKVDAADCAAMRERVHDGATVAAVTEAREIGQTAVRHHLHGHCTHDVAVEPVGDLQ